MILIETMNFYGCKSPDKCPSPKARGPIKICEKRDLLKAQNNYFCAILIVEIQILIFSSTPTLSLSKKGEAGL